MIRRERSNRLYRRRSSVFYKKCLFLACVVAAYAWYYHGWVTFVVDNGLIKSETFEYSPPVNEETIQGEKHAAVVSTPGSFNSNVGSVMTPSVSEHDDNNTANSRNTSVGTLASARFSNGSLGYVADPTSLRKGIASFLSIVNSSTSHPYDKDDVTTLLAAEPHLYWKLLQDYPVEYATDSNDTDSSSVYSHEILSPQYICALGPGRGFEQDYGYRLLSEKIQVYNETNITTTTPRILCLVYTYPKMRFLQRTQALTWGYQCDGYLAFSTETVPNLGLVDLQHNGDESYDNMWQKVRSIWNYVYQHYRHDFDLFLLGGDDLYVIVPNLRKFLSQYMNQHDPNKPIYLGQWIPLPGNDNEYYVSGGPGYTLNQVALTRLVEDALPTCRVNVRASFEDRLVSHCLQSIDITGGDTRDKATGEQLYHDCSPAHLYTFQSTRGRGSFHAKAAAYWETLPHPTNVSRKVGPKHGLQGAGRYSVSFHDIYHPSFMARLHAILYQGVCNETTTALGRALATPCT